MRQNTTISKSTQQQQITNLAFKKLKLKRKLQNSKISYKLLTLDLLSYYIQRFRVDKISGNKIHFGGLFKFRLKADQKKSQILEQSR